MKDTSSPTSRNNPGRHTNPSPGAGKSAPDFQNLFEAAPSKMLVLRRGSFEIVAATDAYLAATMTRRDDVLGRSIFEIFPDDAADAMADGAQNLRASLERVEASRKVDAMPLQRYPVRRRRKDGGEFEDRFWSVVNSPAVGPRGDVEFIIHRVEDVTEFVPTTPRRIADGEPTRSNERQLPPLEINFAALLREQRLLAERLNDERSKLLEAQAVANVGSWATDLATLQVTWSEETFRIFEVAPVNQPMTHHEFLAYVHPDDREAVNAAFIQSGTTKDICSIEHRLLLPGGRIKTVVERWRVYFDDIGKPTRAVGTCRDITQQRLLEEELRKKVKKQTALADYGRHAIASARLSDVSAGLANQIVSALNADICAVLANDVSQDLVWIVDKSGVKTGASDSWKLSTISDTSITKSPIRTQRPVRFADLALEKSIDLAPFGAEAGIRSGVCAPVKANTDRYILICVFSETPRHFTESDVEFLSTFGSMVAVLWEREQTQDRLRQRDEELRQAQKMEVIGQLAGGVAHDFNNLLTVILGNAEILEDKLQENDILRDMAALVKRAAARGAALTSRMLTFARRQPLEPRAVDPNNLIAGMSELLKSTLGEDIDIKFLPAAEAAICRVDPVQLENAILNLAVNARDAMPNGGRLTIETKSARIDQADADPHGDITLGRYFLIEISDTGSGIAPENIERVFEPFFTTKEIGQGTGLGLSMVFGFVKQSNGHIKIYSEVAVGTTIKIYLPTVSNQLESVEVETRSISRLRGTEKILVVEDDELVRDFATRQLAKLGYRVLAAVDGPQALATLRECTDIDLLFTDVIMPGGMNGRQLAEAASALRPGLKILYTSGYTESALVHHGRLEKGVHLLTKPYPLQELARKLRDVLSDSV